MSFLHKRFTLGLLLCALFLVSAVAPNRSTASATTQVSPLEDTTTILQNPLMGFEDHAVHGNWWPFSTGYLRATATCDRNGSSVPCGPLNWDRINPQLDTYNFDDIDLFISNMAAQQKFVQFRVRNVVNPGDRPNVPAWAQFAGVTWSNGREPWDNGNPSPEIDYQKCVFLDLWGKLVQQLVQRYDNNPQVSVIDIGSYGYYGEWFSGKTVLQRDLEDQIKDATDPTLQQSIDTRTRIVRMFTGGNGSGRCVDSNGQEKIVSYSYPGFKNKPVLISRGDQEDVQIGVANGAGIRFDGIGANDHRNQDFRDRISGMIAQTWQSKPIMGEFGSPDYAPLDSGFLQRSLCFVREFHVSAIHNNFDSKPNFDLNPLFREMGYRILLNQASYPSSAAPGETATFDFTWLNKGTSPAYQRYPLKLYFKPAGSDTVAAEVTLPTTDIRQILPAGITSGSTDFMSCPKATPRPLSISESVTIPVLAGGRYDLYFAFQEPIYLKPIQLALNAKDSAGRYLLGSMDVGGSAAASPTAVASMTSVGVSPTIVPSITSASTATPTAPSSWTPTSLPTTTLRPTNTPIKMVTKTPTSAPTSVKKATATPTNSIKPTTITLPTNTPRPTNTPVIPSPTGTANLKVQYQTDETRPSAEALSFSLNIINTGKTTLPLNGLTVRYYFTRDNQTPMKFTCDYAAIGCDQVSGHLADLPQPTSNADCYVEVSFTGGGSLNPGAKTNEILLRVNRTDWSNFDQSNDYSFDPSKSSFHDWDHVTIYQNGTLLWGTPPGGSGPTPLLSTPNPTSTSALMIAALPLTEADNANVQRMGKWTSKNTSSASGGRYLYASHPGDTLSLTFTGTQIGVIYVKHPNFGTFAIEIDGKTVQTIDAQSDQKAFGVWATVSGLTPGTHNLRVHPVEGTIAIDAFAANVVPGVVVPPTSQPSSAPTQTPDVFD